MPPRRFVCPQAGSCQARPLARRDETSVKAAQPFEHLNRGGEVPLINVHDVQTEQWGIRRQVVEDIEEDALRDVERAGERAFSLLLLLPARRALRSAALEQELIEVLGNVH